VLNVCDLSWELFNGKWVAVDRYAYGFFAWRHVWGMQMVDRGGDGLPGSSHSVPGHRKTKIEQIPDKLEFGLVFLFGFFFYFFGPFLCQRNFLAFFLFSFLQLFFGSSLLLFLQDFASNMRLAIMIISTLPARPVEK